MAMASATSTMILSFNRLAISSAPTQCSAARGISLTHFNKHLQNTFILPFSHSISPSGLRPLVLQKRIGSHTRQSRPSSFTVFAAKRYKMKTHKASAKRFRVTGTGKIVRRRAGKQHLLAKKKTKRKVRLSKMAEVNRRDYNNVIGAMPYLKVNRKAQ
ncbi:hypothetical protein Cgig2_018922 [Carnegiea gigantea]|uniref:50S ribosomal protein L35 n=1 Tax=Carnegiea gigantea TaxID=171969 RepID=A0A9Q1GV46_9CARY|nr:hypothetical protein Cgig2_018922 [Carnegiea gigantea]